MLFFGSNNNNELMMLVWIQSTSRLFSTRSLGQQRLPSRCGNRNWIRRSDWQRLFLDYPKAFTFTCINLISCWPWGRSSALPLGSRVDCRGENLYRKKCLWLSDLLQTRKLQRVSSRLPHYLRHQQRSFMDVPRHGSLDAGGIPSLSRLPREMLAVEAFKRSVQVDLRLGGEVNERTSHKGRVRDEAGAGVDIGRI